MDVKNWLCFASLICVTLATTNEEPEYCPLEISSEYVDLLECADGGNSLAIWEDCLAGVQLFTTTDPTFLKDDPKCPFLLLAEDKFSFMLKKELDAEGTEKIGPCFITTSDEGKRPTFVNVLDVNEFIPQPSDGVKVKEVPFKEGQDSVTEIIKFTYIDEDFDETNTLKGKWISDEFDDSFRLTQSENTFTLSTKISLDFETRTVYKLMFSIISIDLRGKELSNNHTVLLFVEDVGDTAPYWIQRQPVAYIHEGPADRPVYQVEAADRDFDIGNSVKYSITGGNDEGFFEVDMNTGKVKLAKEIDHEKDTAFFPIEITAQEYYKGGPPAPAPSSDTVITNVYIEDANDESPTFNHPSYEVEMPEYVDSEFFIDVEIFVCDADTEGDFNRYSVTSDQESYLEISPDVTRGNTSIQLKVLKNPNTIFDYETQSEPIVITLTATETDTESHYDTVKLTVNLLDQNDHDPKFESEPYEKTVDEDKGQGYLVTTVKATDGDRSSEFGTESIRYSVDCPNILEVDEVTGDVTLARDNALDYEDEQTRQCSVFADDDQGGAQYRRANSTITITVHDVNDSPPTLSVENGEITENSAEGTKIAVNIEANDADTRASLDFEIDWDISKAYKDDNPVSIDDVKSWFMVKLADGASGNTVQGSLEIGSGSPDREVADKVMISVKVIDTNTESGLDHKEEDLEIAILDENDSYPDFEGDYGDLRVRENTVAGTEIGTILTSDADHEDHVTFSIDDTTYVNVQQIGTSFSASLVVSEGADIDREQNGTITVTVTATDDNSQQASIELVITVDDENDNAPVFQDDIIYASFTENDKIGSPLLTFKALDVDLNEVLQYKVSDDFMWPNGGPESPPETPFQVESKNGNGTLLLNFAAIGINSGYCNFSIECYDNDETHIVTVQAKVYAIAGDYQISVFYNNPSSETQARFIDIQATFSDVYKHPCIIDGIAAGEDEMKSVATMHFIDQVDNEPVPADDILTMTQSPEVAQKLVDKNSDLGLSLQRVGNSVLPDSSSGANTVLILQILLGVVAMVMGSLVLLLTITYFMRTRSLERRLKVANTTTFGSMSSDLNRMDKTGGVPGSNQFTGESANPMYNIPDDDMGHFDTNSIGSGDSVLVGVEDNPEFRGFSKGQTQGPYPSEGHSNPAFNRSIDMVAATPPLFDGGTRSNPLMDADEGLDLSDAFQNHELVFGRPSISSGNSGESSGVDQEPNFSFGNF